MQVASAPFQVGTLFLPMPWAFIVHMPAYLIGEMWIGVCVAVVVDLVPPHLTASAVAIYFFVIQLIGGNINVIVTPIADALNYRLALLITFPGFYVAGAAIFAVCLAVHVCRNNTAGDGQCDNEEQTTADENVTGSEIAEEPRVITANDRPKLNNADCVTSSTDNRNSCDSATDLLNNRPIERSADLDADNCDIRVVEHTDL